MKKKSTEIVCWKYKLFVLAMSVGTYVYMINHAVENAV